MDLNRYNITDATHVLTCRHCVGSGHCRNYTMKAIKLGTTKSGKIKILVFGERNWKYKEHIKKIRYVDKDRLLEIKNEI